MAGAAAEGPSVAFPHGTSHDENASPLVNGHAALHSAHDEKRPGAFQYKQNDGCELALLPAALCPSQEGHSSRAYAGGTSPTPPYPLAGPLTGGPWYLKDAGTVRGQASPAYALLQRAPHAIRDIWSASFEAKKFRRRTFLQQIDLRAVCLWVSELLEEVLLSPTEGPTNSAAFAVRAAVYGQLLPQIIWAMAIVVSRLTTITLQEATALWARIQLLALDATSSNAAAATGSFSREKASNQKHRDPLSAVYGPSRSVGHRKRRRPPPQQQQQDYREDTAVEAMKAAASSSVEPDMLLQQIARVRGSSSQRDAEDSKASVLLSRFVGGFGGEEETSFRASSVSSPFAALRQDLLQLGALRCPGGGELLFCGDSSMGSSTTSLAVSVVPEAAEAAAFATAPRAGNSSNSNSNITIGQDRWTLMPWQSAAAAAAAALQHGISRRSSFSSVASELLPPGQQQRQHQDLLLQGPLSFEVPVGAAVDPVVASPFRVQQRPLLPSEPSSVGSGGSKRTGVSAAGTPDHGWVPDLLLQQQDMGLGDWQLPEEEPSWQHGSAAAAATALATTPAGAEPASDAKQLDLAIPQELQLTAGGSRRRRRRTQQQKLQLDETLCRSSLPKVAAARQGSNRHGDGQAKEAAAAAIRLLEAGTDDGEALKRNFRCYWGILERQMGIRAFLKHQHQQQPQRLIRKRLDARGTAAAHPQTILVAHYLGGGALLLPLPSPAQAAAVAVRDFFLRDSAVEQVLQGQQLAVAAAAADDENLIGGSAAAPRTEGSGAAQASQAADAAATEAAAAAAAATLAARRRTSSWLDRQNVLRGFDSPLPPADASEGGDEADRWGDSHWGEGTEQYQQEEEGEDVLKDPFDGVSTEQQRRFLDDEIPRPPARPSEDPQGIYRKTDGVRVMVCPSAASLYELMESHFMSGAAGFYSHSYSTPPPPPAAPPPLDLSDLLSGHSRRTAARAFRDALTLHSHGLCTLKQEMLEVPAVPLVASDDDPSAAGRRAGGTYYPRLLILSQDASEEDRNFFARPAAAAADAADAGDSTRTHGQRPSSSGVQAINAFHVDRALDEETSDTLIAPLVPQQHAADLREHAATVAAAAADAAAAEAAGTGEAPITDEQLEQAVQWLVTGLLDRLQEQARLHAHELVHWFVREMLPSSSFADIASPTAWEAKAIYAICTLIDEGVFVASAAAPSEAPVGLAVTNRGLQKGTRALDCPFWLEGVADVD